MIIPSLQGRARGFIFLTAQKWLKYSRAEDYYREIKRHGHALNSFYLGRILQYARANVSYYRDAASDLGGRVLTKTLIKKNFNRLMTDELSRRQWIWNSSGGSTGEPQVFIQDKEQWEWSVATSNYYYRDFLGVEPAAVPKVVIWGSERDIFHHKESVISRIANQVTRTTFINSFNMSPAIMSDAIDIINKIKPVFIKGYAGSLYELAKFIRRINASVHQLAFIYSAAETLRPFMRTIIEEVFNCKVFNFYGSRETGDLAGECRLGSMHIFSFNNHLEVVDDRGMEVSPGQEGDVIVTTLHNYAMPLIRYKIGDRAVKGDGCDCGCDLPTLKTVTGRVTDNFIAPGNVIVHGEYFTHLFYFQEWIKEFQVLQEDLNRITIFIVPVDGGRLRIGSDWQSDINQKIYLVMGEECGINWEIVDRVPRTPEGKYLFTRSLIYEK